MSTTALDALNSLLSAEDKAAFSALLSKNPKVAAKIGTGVQFLMDYAPDANENVDDKDDAAQQREAARVVEAARLAEAERVRNAAPPKDASPLADLKDIDALIDRKVNERLTAGKYLTGEEAAKAKTEIMTGSLALADDYAEIREQHREEFGERLNRPDFEKFVKDTPNKFGTLKAAHDAFVNEKRIEQRVEKGVAEALKLKTSQKDVPAQTTSSALSPAQEIIRKAKATETGAGESNVSRAAARLAQVMKNREGRESADAA